MSIYKHYLSIVIFYILIGCNGSDENHIQIYDISGDWEFTFYYAQDSIESEEPHSEVLNVSIEQALNGDITLNIDGASACGYLYENTSIYFYCFYFHQVPVIAECNLLFNGTIDYDSGTMNGVVYEYDLEAQGIVAGQLNGDTWDAVKI